jgi:ATP-binding cassette subfamily F protein 3
LIELVADRLWLAADGHVRPFAGDMDDYARFVLDRAKAGIRAPAQKIDRGIVPAQRPARRKQKGYA